MSATTFEKAGVLPEDDDVRLIVDQGLVIRDAQGVWLAEYRPGAALEALDAIGLDHQPDGSAPNTLPWFGPLTEAVGLGTCMWMTYGQLAAPQVYHQDLWAEATTDEWCSAIAVRRGGDYTGFLTVLAEPGPGVAFDLMDGDLLVFDHMIWHGNTMFEGDLDRQVIVMAFAQRPK